MNLKQLEYFVQVAELGSFSKAAVVLDIAQPALSRQVRSLETELHQQLFLRNGRGVALTDAGKRLFDHSVAVLQLMAHAREDLGASRNEPIGRVTIGLPPSMGRQLTLPLIDRFKKELPSARLAIVEGLSTHIVEWVTTGRIDIGLVYNPEAQPGLEITPLLQEQLGLVGHDTQGKRKRAALPPLPMKELSHYPLIVPERVHAMRRLLDTQAALAGIKLDIAWEVSSVPVDHRPGLRRLWLRGAHRQRRGRLGALGRTGDTPAGGPDAGQRALPGDLGAPASDAADPAYDAAVDRAGARASRLIIFGIVGTPELC